MLPWIALLATTLAAATRADVLIVSPRVRYCGRSSNQGSIASDSKIITELDCQQKSTAPGGMSLSCIYCPAVKTSNGEGYTLLGPTALNSISVEFNTANQQLNLNGNPFLDSQMKDLHRPQSTTQELSYLDLQNGYSGSLPIMYDARVVQVRIVQIEDGSLVEFYSIDVQVLSLGGRSIDVQKVNCHVIKRTDGAVRLVPPEFTS